MFQGEQLEPEGAQKFAKETERSLMRASMIFLSLWQTFAPPPAPVAPLETSTRDDQIAQVHSGSLNGLSASSLINQPDGVSAVIPSLSPAKELKTLESPLIQRVTIDTRGQITRWVNLEEQYSQSTETGRLPYILEDIR